RPGQHELGLEDCPGRLHTAVQRCRHPAQSRVPDLALDIGEDMTSIALVPAPVQVLGHHPKLDNEIARKVLWLDLTPLFLPESDKGGLVSAHDDPGIRPADEVAAVLWRFFPHHLVHLFLRGPEYRLLGRISHVSYQSI